MIGQLHKRYLLEDYWLEPEKQLLSRGGRPVHLPKKPFQVLVHLIEHRDRYVGRTELFDLFWEGREVYDDALRKCIGAIRKALDDQSEKPLFIETRWGVGYRYIGPVEEQLVREEAAIVEIEKTRGVKIVVEEEEIQDESAVDSRADVNLKPARAMRLTAAQMLYPKLIALALISLAVAIGALMFISSRQSGRRSVSVAGGERAPILSITVLPLRNLTGDQAHEYLTDGITENLISALSKIDGLKVISRGSSFAFKGKEVGPREVGRQLGVAAVLEGSVRKSGEQLRVDVRLLSTSDGQVLWAGEAYGRSVEDVFVIQEEIARNVASGLRIKLRGDGEQRLAKRYTHDVVAYAAYLKGRYFLNKRTTEGILKGIEYLQQAIEIDPNYALAYAGLADAYDKAYWFLPTPPRDLMTRAKAAATRALALDDSLGEAHLAMALVYANQWDLSNATRETERAIEINPSDADAHHHYAYRLMQSGRPDEALAEIKRARELDPLNVVMNVDVGEILLYARRYDEAIEALKHAIEMDAGRANVHYDLAQAYERKGLEGEAVEEYLKDEALSGGNYKTIALLREAYAASGVKGFWRAKIKITKERLKGSYTESIIMAKLHARLGNENQAFGYLEKAYAERSPSMADLRVDPSLDALRSDPRYTDLLRRVGLE